MKGTFAALGLALVLNVAAYATQSAPAQKVIKDPAEYNAYIAALNTADPGAKAAAMEAFFTQYPASVVKVEALEQAMAAYQMSGNSNKVGQTAERLLQIDPANIRALAIAAFVKRATATANNDTKLGQDVGDLAERGLAALPDWSKPEGLTDADFHKLRDQMSAIFYGAAGFAALQAKDFAKARDSYQSSVKIDPTNMQDIYQLGIADLQMTPLDPVGFWYTAKAVSLAQMQKNPTAANSIAAFGEARYKRYHGNVDGWDKVVAAAAGQTEPPPNFAVSIKAVTPAEIACQAVAENDPDTLSFSDWEFVLSMRDAAPCNKAAADKVWDAIQDNEKQGAAKLQFTVKVISVSDKTIEAAITEENQSANKADLRVAMAEPLEKPPVPGTMIDIIGVITDYVPKPFIFLMREGELLGGRR
ncbi:MAG TPA: hypothetical protein VKH81_13745 [Candidatus Angelobacter sp.]|nr:hypothetical protein [Candidatus Angelobacter sp.]